MKIIEILFESLDPQDIEKIKQTTDINQAKKMTLDLMFANTSSLERRADLRAAVQKAGTVQQLIQQLWNMLLSKEIPTGFQTVKTKKGIASK